MAAAVNFQNSPIGFPSLVPSKANTHRLRGSCCCCRGGNPHRGVARKKNSGGINGSRPCIWIRLPICMAYTFWIITRLVPALLGVRPTCPVHFVYRPNLIWFGSTWTKHISEIISSSSHVPFHLKIGIPPPFFFFYVLDKW